MQIEDIFHIQSEEEFNKIALQVFRYQYQHLGVYRHFVQYLKKDIHQIQHYTEIPFLPISFFKSHKILSSERTAQSYFQSSGTTQKEKSKHYFEDQEFYLKSCRAGILQSIGNPKESIILGLLPNYLENPHSSLIAMVDDWMQLSADPNNGYFLDDFQALSDRLQSLVNSPKQVILIGVSYALLDFSQAYPNDMKNLVILETGGMKGRKKEWSKKQLLDHLHNAFPKAKIGSEYGMTELFSQAYAMDSLQYKSPPWMKVMIREIEDPQSFAQEGKSGVLNIIDLANYYSCSFIASEDRGRKIADSFEVLGRLDQSDIRGCSLLYTHS